MTFYLESKVNESYWITAWCSCFFWLCLISSIKRFLLQIYLLFVIEGTMNVSDITLEMELNGVDEAVIAEIVKLCEDKGFNSELIDDELQKRGYEKIFTVDYDAYDEYDDWEDDGYASVEKFPHKRSYID